MKYFVLLFMLLGTVNVISQDHFMVDLSNRAPDVQSLVQAYEGSPSIPFLAKDVSGVEHSMAAFNGKTVIMWFWNNDCIKCHEQISALNQLKAEFADNLQIVSFSDNTKDEIAAFKGHTQVDFPIIPNSKTLSEGPYGGDLGYPKIFMLDTKGMIKWVIPEIEMKNNFDTYQFLKTLHTSLHLK